MQDILIVYDSKTGNTEKVAKALAEAAGERCVLAQVDAAPAADDFAVVVAGYWVDKGAPNAKMKNIWRICTAKGSAVPDFGRRPGERPRCKLPGKCRCTDEQGLQGTGYFIYPRCD